MANFALFRIDSGEKKKGSWRGKGMGFDEVETLIERTGKGGDEGDGGGGWVKR